MSTHDKKAEVICKALIQDGMKPSLTGRDEDGKSWEYVSYPWVAGADIFVLIRQPNDPATESCVDALEVLPEDSLSRYLRDNSISKIFPEIS